MTRREFTANLAKLLTAMIADGHEPVVDYVLRSLSEQKRLYEQGLSQCDGVEKVSKHQHALAADIYFVVTDSDDVFVDYGYEMTADLAERYHHLWVSWGGRPMLTWDRGHYE